MIALSDEKAQVICFVPCYETVGAGIESFPALTNIENIFAN